MNFTATCGAGLESLVAEEITSFQGAHIKIGSGSVSWSGSLESGYRACLWSRFASRVLLEVVQFGAKNEEELYAGVKTIAWQDHLTINTTFAVDCSLGPGAPFNHSKYTALKVKDGIADYFREAEGSRPHVQVVRPGVRVNVHSDNVRTVLSIDLSGESLHRRGYRLETGEAPLKETLAAAIIALSGWDGSCALLDPLCGSATLLIEAAMIAGDSAPGLGRTYFGMQGWQGHDDTLWNRLVSEAAEREEEGFARKWPSLIGYDGSRLAVRQARINIANAGFADKITVSRRELFALSPSGEEGCLVCNPPYGERLSEKETVKYLYRFIGNRLQTRFPGWRVGLFTSNPDLADMTGLNWAHRYHLFNGPIACRLFVGRVGNQPAREFRWQVQAPDATEESSDFVNRLRKNVKKMFGWADREGVECFRVYDRDMAEYNVSIDLYGKWVHVQEYAAPASISETVSAERFGIVLKGVRQALGAGRDRVFIKTRKRQRGKAQYQKKTKKRGKLYEVREGDCSFLVNFTDYLDTGLFLDHRNTRLRIGQEAEGKRFLNLYGYTAAATVHAARGGAVSSTTVDLSTTYLQWAEMNFALNGIHPDRHQLVHSDCISWLRENHELFDLIFVDPPTFSNTRKKSRVFDIQNDHVQLLNLAMSRLRDNGLLIFSTNFRSFTLDPRLQDQYACLNISKKSLPLDFQQSPRVHQCWEFRHKNQRVPGNG
ncbi:MAG: bifunctional 23S rRNA (guanine(2069)-N(7))-methyltransferase RlmK/23S rRNA (guanine(2445)-N(2))-methyltransferase RlmL [Desulfocapsaceae bacterium]|jgi:23S rRNA (guanine2445-N2)-methyltransferase / 23S rRNA (guanine2069-N7)-methyltransferase|nr:bifunctional 23S rRNA (guanine(2069)-N(7))-methyltransferase RlmK/23S rRNA (guanine(2445)-N(2))-methyltransferase RlmL [Desulfocapsaceae bacterium]